MQSGDLALVIYAHSYNEREERILMDSIVRRIIKKLGSYKAAPLTRDFIKHNLSYFTGATQVKSAGGPEVLFEFNSMQSSHIAYSYLANVLAAKYGARIIAFTEIRTFPLWRSLEWNISNYFSLHDFAIYRSFGTDGFVRPQVNRNQSVRAAQLAEHIYRGLKTKSDIESISVDGVLLGDLIYDSYLKILDKATIEIADEGFKDFLRVSIGYYVFWDDYFKQHDVCAVNTSHAVYSNAIPLRLALKKGIPAFVSNATDVYRLSSKKMFNRHEFFGFKKEFRMLPSNIQKAGMEQAKKRIELRFSGKAAVDMYYSTKSSFGPDKAERLLEESPRIKVLIASHSFSDSPHVYGNNLFPDFYEWLVFLGKMTLETDYDWYIKTHPDYLPNTMNVIKSFIQKYPKFHLLPADSSHHQIIAEGINVVLTTYGTIGFEYAALGVPVVNASLNNPHIAYNFNLHPKSVDEYRETLRNLEQINLKIDINEVYEYYFMKHLYKSSNWLFDNYEKMQEELGGYYEQYSPKIYEAWMLELSFAKHAGILEKLDIFVDSGEYRLDS